MKVGFLRTLSFGVTSGRRLVRRGGCQVTTELDICLLWKSLTPGHPIADLRPQDPAPTSIHFFPEGRHSFLALQGYQEEIQPKPWHVVMKNGGVAP